MLAELDYNRQDLQALQRLQVCRLYQSLLRRYKLAQEFATGLESLQQKQ